MASIKASFDDFLGRPDIDGLRAALAGWREPLTLPQVNRLAARAAALGPATTTLKIAVVHTYTSDLLEPWLAMWAALHRLELDVYHAPYGMALQEAAPGSPLLAHRPDITLLLLKREDLLPDLDSFAGGADADEADRVRAQALANLRGIVEAFRAQPVGHLVVSLLPPIDPPALGLYDATAAVSQAAWWAATKAAIGRWLHESVAASTLLDLDEVLAQVGREAFFERRYWYTAQFPFGAKAAGETARRIVAIGVVLKTPRAKVLVLDADNTLWGGIVGEDGIDGIALGPDYPGVAYLDFQRRLLALRSRGLILALCSKNNPADVAQVLEQHPHQLLRDRHFAARRVNWSSKVDNLRALAQELNLGLDSFVFVDDSDHECAAVRDALPQVEVIQTPTRPVDVPTCLDQVARLEVLALTREDAAKTELYAQERERRALSESIGSGADAAGAYLARLQMKMTVRLDAASHLARLSQLTQKTNQFNLTTRRYDEAQMAAFIAAPDWLVAEFSLADVFGDSGIVGLALWRLGPDLRAELDTFLMSCRVIGREAEAAFLHALLRHLAEAGIVEVTAEFVPTAKNALAASFLAAQGFEATADGRFARDLRAAAPKAASAFPIDVQLITDSIAIPPRRERTDRTNAVTPS